MIGLVSIPVSICLFKIVFLIWDSLSDKVARESNGTTLVIRKVGNKSVFAAEIED